MPCKQPLLDDHIFSVLRHFQVTYTEDRVFEIARQCILADGTNILLGNTREWDFKVLQRILQLDCESWTSDRHRRRLAPLVARNILKRLPDDKRGYTIIAKSPWSDCQGQIIYMIIVTAIARQTEHSMAALQYRRRLICHFRPTSDWFIYLSAFSYGGQMIVLVAIQQVYLEENVTDAAICLAHRIFGMWQAIGKHPCPLVAQVAANLKTVYHRNMNRLGIDHCDQILADAAVVSRSTLQCATVDMIQRAMQQIDTPLASFIILQHWSNHIRIYEELVVSTCARLTALSAAETSNHSLEGSAQRRSRAIRVREMLKDINKAFAVERKHMLGEEFAKAGHDTGTILRVTLEKAEDDIDKASNPPLYPLFESHLLRPSDPGLPQKIRDACINHVQAFEDMLLAITHQLKCAASDAMVQDSWWTQSALELALHVESIMINQQALMLGDDHPCHWTSKTNKAITLFMMGTAISRQEALEMELDIYEYRLEAVGPMHHDTVMAAAHLCMTLDSADDPFAKFKAQDLAHLILPNLERLYIEGHTTMQPVVDKLRSMCIVSRTTLPIRASTSVATPRPRTCLEKVLQSSAELEEQQLLEAAEALIRVSRGP